MVLRLTTNQILFLEGVDQLAYVNVGSFGLEEHEQDREFVVQFLDLMKNKELWLNLLQDWEDIVLLEKRLRELDPDPFEEEPYQEVSELFDIFQESLSIIQEMLIRIEAMEREFPNTKFKETLVSFQKMVTAPFFGE